MSAPLMALALSPPPPIVKSVLTPPPEGPPLPLTVTLTMTGSALSNAWAELMRSAPVPVETFLMA